MKKKFINKIVSHLEKNKKNLLFSFDLDDTLSETSTKVIEFINKNPETSNILKEKNMYPLKYEDVDDFHMYSNIFGNELTHKIFSFDSLYDDNLLLKSGTLDFINFIKKNFGEDKIRVVTASFPGVEKVKNDFISNALNIDTSQIIHSFDKTDIVKNTIFFDDGFHNLEPLLDCKDTITICMKTPWNEKYLQNKTNLDYSIHDFNEALSIFKQVFSQLNLKKKK